MSVTNKPKSLNNLYPISTYHKESLLGYNQPDIVPILEPISFLSSVLEYAYLNGGVNGLAYNKFVTNSYNDTVAKYIILNSDYTQPRLPTDLEASATENYMGKIFHIYLNSLTNKSELFDDYSGTFNIPLIIRMPYDLKKFGVWNYCYIHNTTAHNSEFPVRFYYDSIRFPHRLFYDKFTGSTDHIDFNVAKYAFSYNVAIANSNVVSPPIGVTGSRILDSLMCYYNLKQGINLLISWIWTFESLNYKASNSKQNIYNYDMSSIMDGFRFIESSSDLASYLSQIGIGNPKCIINIIPYNEFIGSNSTANTNADLIPTIR